MSQVGSGRAKRFSNLTDRVGSGREVFKCHGSGRVMFREILVTLASGHHDTGVVFGCPVGRACGSVSLQTYSCLPRGHSREPRVRNFKILAASCLKASLGPIFRTPSAYNKV